MAALKKTSWTTLSEWMSASAIRQTEKAKETIRETYKKSGGPTPGLERLYGGYIDASYGRKLVTA